jgi:hypothetical protein
MIDEGILLWQTHLLGFVHRGLTNPKQEYVKSKAANSKKRQQNTWKRVWKMWELSNHPGPDARAGLFIVGDQRSYYNALTALNYLPANRVYN